MKTMLTVGVAISIRPWFQSVRGIRPGVSVTVVSGYPYWFPCIDGISTGAPETRAQYRFERSKVMSVQEYPSKKYSFALNHLYDSTAGD